MPLLVEADFACYDTIPWYAEWWGNQGQKFNKASVLHNLTDLI